MTMAKQIAHLGVLMVVTSQLCISQAHFFFQFTVSVLITANFGRVTRPSCLPNCYQSMVTRFYDYQGNLPFKLNK